MKTLVKKIVILVCEGPYTHQAANSAYLFAKAALEKGQSIEQVFFYYDGAYVASKLSSVANGEADIIEKWANLAKQYDLNLLVCSNVALRRGIIDSTHTKSSRKFSANLHPAFKLIGLGQFAEALNSIDRLITFGD